MALPVIDELAVAMKPAVPMPVPPADTFAIIGVEAIAGEREAETKTEIEVIIVMPAVTLSLP